MPRYVWRAWPLYLKLWRQGLRVADGPDRAIAFAFLLARRRPCSCGWSVTNQL